MDAVEKVPRHIAIIMDGNRRFAKKLMLKPWMGHEWGEKKVEQVLDWCHELGVHELTLYALSLQNMGRPKEELDYLMNVFRKAFDRLMNERKTDIMSQGIRFLFIGRLHLLPADVQEKAAQLMELTKSNTQHIVNLAMAYGGREEVVDAARKIADQVKNGQLNLDEITEEIFNKNVYLQSTPDLILRTGGDQRTSNFLNWQSSYSELIFIEKTWPEMEKEDFVTAIQDFKSRERRVGK